MLRTATFIEYACYLTACTDLAESMKIYVDPGIYQLSYGIIDHQLDVKTSMPSVSVENTPNIQNTRSEPQVMTPNETLTIPTLAERKMPPLKIKMEDTPHNSRSDIGSHNS